MKGSFRDTQLAFAAQVRKFIDRRRPESAPDNPTSTALIGALLAGLDEALDGIPDGLGGVLANDPACRRKAAALKVRFAALRALELRALTGDDPALAEGAALTEGARWRRVRPPTSWAFSAPNCASTSAASCWRRSATTPCRCRMNVPATTRRRLAALTPGWPDRVCLPAYWDFRGRSTRRETGWLGSCSRLRTPANQTRDI